ncbi:TELO2-interacting protein 2 [Gastrophryne carolinensis]
MASALSELSVCLGRSDSLPRSPAACAELFQAVVVWAAPGPDEDSHTRVPARFAAASSAFLSLLEAVKPALHDDTGICRSSSAGEGSADTVRAKDLSQEDRPSPNWDVAAQSEEVSSNHLDHKLPSSTSRTKADPSVVDTLDPKSVLECSTAPLLLLCGAHTQPHPWTDACSRSLASQLLQSLLEAWRCDSITDLLKGPQTPEPEFHVFQEALGLLGPRLRKDTWESHPDAKIVFSWMMYQIPRPWLTDFLSRVLPPSLLFSDHYKPENRVLGIRCLHHIIRNVPAADLRQYNRAMVVYHALYNHLYTTDTEVIEVVLPCLLDLFPVLHKPTSAIGAYRKDGESPLDQVMQMVLTHMEMEHKIVLRWLYARNLPALQERLGVRVVRHMKRLLRVIVGYLEVFDGPEETARLHILETLQGTIKYAWPRIPARLPLLVKTLLKLMYEVSADPGQHSQLVRTALLQGATECLVLLDRSSKGQVKIALEEIPSLCKEPDLLKCINKVLQDTT